MKTASQKWKAHDCSHWQHFAANTLSDSSCSLFYEWKESASFELGLHSDFAFESVPADLMIDFFAKHILRMG